ncbi:MAG: S8 family serine peptidase [Bdellovibrionales bacterium]|nr:S8 family serine peptidase [Bdellovibrionales bacterium]
MKNVPILILSTLYLNSPYAAFAKPIPEALVEELRQSSEAELETLFSVRNHKGESIFKSARGLEKGIWATRDPELDQIEGTSTDRVYRKFRIPKRGSPVIVAVIDSGIDISHPELREKLWTNEAELNGKPGIDDDGDGYIDDVYGWNFIGNKDGRNLNETNLELARVYSSLKRKEAEGALSPEETALLKKTGKELTSAVESTTKSLIRYEAFLSAIELLKKLGLKAETMEALDAFSTDDPEARTALSLARVVYSNGITSVEIREGVNYFNTRLKFHLNPGFNASEIIGDDPENLEEKGYGNPDVTGPDSLHGTHVAGIIAADRDNSFGIEGQARNVKIMALRAVPDGDERDKDVANAIRFAVDHGAQIINMSFGKSYSPQKTVVDQAVLYAESNGVLLVHAAGNDNKNTEIEENYPTRKLNVSTTGPHEVQNWIEVGASGPKRDATLPASFSNFGKTSVDVFAPGVSIVSTAPGNSYKSLDGTSMAAPEVAGVAALLWGRVPSADYRDVKAAIFSNVNRYPELLCEVPGSDSGTNPRLAPFESLSVTGGTVNAFESLRWLLAH